MAGFPLLPFALVRDPRYPPQQPFQQSPLPQPPRSPDGRFWWDGRQWLPVQAPPASARSGRLPGAVLVAIVLVSLLAVGALGVGVWAVGSGMFGAGTGMPGSASSVDAPVQCRQGYAMRCWQAVKKAEVISALESQGLKCTPLPNWTRCEQNDKDTSGDPPSYFAQIGTGGDNDEGVNYVSVSTLTLLDLAPAEKAKPLLTWLAPLAFPHDQTNRTTASKWVETRIGDKQKVNATIGGYGYLFAAGQVEGAPGYSWHLTVKAD